MSGLTSTRKLLHTSGMADGTDKARKRAAQYKWRAKNKDKVAAWRRAHYLAHKEQYAQRMRLWKKNNKDKQREYNVRCRNRRRDFIRSYKTICSSCGQTDANLLDFHHIDPSTKRGHISTIYRSYGPEAALAEIHKCVVLCKACHRDTHNTHTQKQACCPKCNHSFKV